MASYIDVDNLNVSDYIEVWECNCSENGRQVVMAVDDLHYLPTVDVQEVKHGKWTRGEGPSGSRYAHCSACNRKMNEFCYGYLYCPLCGAKMDKE